MRDHFRNACVFPHACAESRDRLRITSHSLVIIRSRMADDFIPPQAPEPDTEFDSENLIKTVVAVPLLRDIEKDESALLYVIVDMNTRYEGGRNSARDRVLKMVGDAISEVGDPAVKQ